MTRASQIMTTTTVSTKTSSYTLAAADENTIVSVDSASATTITVPTDATVNFTIGTQIIIVQKGAGQVTVSAAGGVTLSSSGSKFKTKAQNAAIALIKTASNTWFLVGNRAA